MTTLLRLLVFIGILAQAATTHANFFSAGSGKVAWQSDLKKAGLESKRSGKPILLQLTASWCGYCHKMLKETYTDPTIAKKVNDHFIPLLLDADENESVVEMLDVSSFPSTIIISSDFDILGRIAGFQKPDAFSKQIATYIKTTEHVQIAQTGNLNPPSDIKESARHRAPPTLSQLGPLPKLTANAELPTSKTSTPSVFANSKTIVTRPESAGSTGIDTSGLGRPEKLRESLQLPRETIAAQPTTITAARHETSQFAFEGMCLVSMLEDREPIVGDEQFSLEYHGTKLLFRDAKQLAKFNAEPTKYWPWFDGRCPVATSNAERSTIGRPQFGGAYRGRLIFFRNAEHRTTFSRDPVRYMATSK